MLLVTVAFLRLQLKSLVIKVARILYWLVKVTIKNNLPSLLTPTPIRAQIQLRGGTGACSARRMSMKMGSGDETKSQEKWKCSVCLSVYLSACLWNEAIQHNPPLHSSARRELKEKPVNHHNYRHGAQAFFEKLKAARLVWNPTQYSTKSRHSHNERYAILQAKFVKMGPLGLANGTVCIVTLEVSTAGAVCSLMEVCRRFGEYTSSLRLLSGDEDEGSTFLGNMDKFRPHCMVSHLRR